jgi:hypothetical protein
LVHGKGEAVVGVDHTPMEQGIPAFPAIRRVGERIFIQSDGVGLELITGVQDLISVKCTDFEYGYD